MEYDIDKILFSQILTYLVSGIILYLIFYIIHGYIIPVIKDRYRFFIMMWHRIEITIWVLFSSLVFSSLFRANMFITVIFTIIILGLGWNHWRNVFSGVLIKFNDQFKPGDIISTDFATGELKTIKLSQSELIDENGETVIIPNYLLKSAVLKHLHKKSNIKTATFKIKTSADKTTEDIYQMALTCPYISTNHEITVEKKQHGEFVIKAAVIDEAFIEKVYAYFGTGNFVDEQ